MNILLVDDDTFFLKKLEKDLFVYFSEFFEEVNFISYSSNFSSIKYDINFNYAFIDIDLNDDNGINIASYLKENLPKTTLIFVSAHSNLIHNSLVVQPFYFIRKFSYQKDIDTFFELIEKLKKDKRLIGLNYGGEKRQVFTDEIIYIEVQLHKLTIQATNNKFCDHRSMKEILSFLPKENFVRVHKSFTININHLISYKSNTIKLSNNNKIIIGRAYKKDFEQFYQRYLIR